MTTNNTYLKTIAEKVTETTISGTHPDNYYLRLICEKYGYTYTGTVCDGKLIKDFASYVTSKTYNRIHFDNKYYHDIAESLTGNTYDNKYDNFYLGIIAENITPPTPLKKLDHINVELIAGNQILSYFDEQQSPDSQYATVRFTAYVDAGETETIPNLSLDFKVGSGAVTSVVTDSNGRYEYTYHSQGVGNVEIVASKTVEGRLVSKTFAIEDCWKYDASGSSGVSNYDTSLLNGSLSYDTTYSAYKVTKSSNGYGILFDNSINLPVNVVITADMMVISGSGNHHIANGIGLYDSSESLGVGCHFVKHHSAHEFDLITFNTSSSVLELGKDSNVSTSSNTWYHIEVKITDTTVTAKMYLNDTVISSHTHSNTVNSGNDNKLAFMQYVVNGTPYFKNIKVKPL